MKRKSFLEKDTTMRMLSIKMVAKLEVCRTLIWEAQIMEEELYRIRDLMIISLKVLISSMGKVQMVCMMIII
jgi:hypothetical protein